MHDPILITGEKPREEENPSSHPTFKSRYPTLFAPLQTEGYRRVRAGQSCALVAPTSSGKTLAVAAPLFEARRPAVFVLPFRSLILDHSQELPRIASMFGIPETAFARIQGGTIKQAIAEAVKQDYLLATPDKLIALIAGGREGNAAATKILKDYDFVFDEVHVYNAMMRTSLLYFLRSVRHLQEFEERKSAFYFLSATFPEELWEMLQEELSLIDDDRIEGVSFTGDVRLVIRPFLEETKTTDGRVPIADDMEDLDIDRDVVGIFNSAYRAWEVCQALDGLLFIGQDKLSEKRRQNNFAAFNDNPALYALIGSPAIEAGVDFVSSNLVIEESYQDSFVQRFGRAARAGRDAFVLAYSNTLHDLQQRGLLAPQYTRAEFLDLLHEHTTPRTPRRLFEGLAAYSYYCYWNEDPTFPMEPEHRKLCKRLRKKGVDPILAFRGLIPYARYESGETISYKALFRKRLPYENGKVSSSPSPERYYYAPQRMPVIADVIDGVKGGKEILNDDTQVEFVKVAFSQKFGAHWVLLELSRSVRIKEDSDNMRLYSGGKALDGGGQSLVVKFYSVDD